MKNCNCGHNHDTGFTRREFFQVGSAGVFGYALTKFLHPAVTLAQGGDPLILDTAKSCIFVMLNGGPSHLDTFDVKPGPWMPENFDVQTVNGINLPVGIFPELSRQARHLAIVRSHESWSAAHEIAQYWIYTGQNRNIAFINERPGLGAVVAYEYGTRRRPEDIFPGFIGLNGGIPYGNGFLSALYSPFVVTANPNGLPGMDHPEGETRFRARYDLLQTLDAELRGADNPLGKPVEDYAGFYDATRGLMYNPTVQNTFRFTTQESQRYGNNGFGNSCIVARNLVREDKGTAFVFLTLGGWDMHVRIYGDPIRRNGGLYSLGGTLDKGLGNLIADLAALPGRAPDRTLLDETLIVMVGDFGRTPPNRYPDGRLNNDQGRDHWNASSFALFAGGGVRGGRLIGETDGTGDRIIEPGWQHRNRVPPYGPNIRTEDIAATIYSAMGIDWFKEIRETPSGRPHQYIPGGRNTFYRVIEELFE